MNRARWFALVVAAQALLLLGWAGYCEWARSTSPTILLQTRPVDPRDLLRGDYMILGYEIGRVPIPPPAEGTMTSPPPAPGRDVWVTLRRNGRFHAVESATWTEPPGVAPDRVLVRGRVQMEPLRGATTMNVDYGIEKYFVPEGRGRPQFKEMIVEATVGPTHTLGIKRLLLDGKPYP